MENSKRRPAVLFAAGIGLGAVAAAALVLGLKSSDPPASSTASAGASPAATPARAEAKPTAVAAVAGSSSCSMSAAVRSAGADDGRFDAAVADGAKTLLVQGKEAAAAGRDKDAESAFLAACKAAGNDVMAVADAKYQLARHYAGLAQEGAGNADELRKRARTLYGESHASYRAQLGDDHEKTRFATRGLEALGEGVVVASGVSRPGGFSDPVPPITTPSTAAAPTTPAAPPAPTARPAPPAVVAQATQPAPAKPVTPPAPAVTQQPTAPPRVAQAPAPTPRVAPEAAAPQTRVAQAPATPAPRTAPAPQTARPEAPQTVRQATGQTERPVTVARAPEPRTPVVEREEPEPPTSATGSARTTVAARPSFDCAKARSVPEKLICADSDLARMDRELGRLYSQAKRAAPDAAAFQRVSDREWRRREAECRDRECLVSWYAQRRVQLNQQLASSGEGTVATR